MTPDWDGYLEYYRFKAMECCRACGEPEDKCECDVPEEDED